MDFTKAVAIFISGIFAPAMIDTLMCIAPSLVVSLQHAGKYQRPA